MRNYIFFIFALFLVGCKTQTVAQRQRVSYTEDLTVVRPVYELPKIDKDSLINPVYPYPEHHANQKALAMQDSLKKVYESYKYTSGFRVQIYAGGSEDKAKEARTKVKEIEGLEGIPVHLVYDMPNFRVKVGDFIDKLMAFRAYIKLKEDFPAAIIVPDNRVILENIK